MYKVKKTELFHTFQKTVFMHKTIDTNAHSQPSLIWQMHLRTRLGCLLHVNITELKVITANNVLFYPGLVLSLSPNYSGWVSKNI